MFESLEIRKAANGFILVVNTEEEQREYVYDTERKLLRVIKQHLGEKITNDEWNSRSLYWHISNQLLALFHTSM